MCKFFLHTLTGNASLAYLWIMAEGNLLIVDDNLNAIRALRLFLKHEFGLVKGISNPNSIPNELDRTPYDLVLLDMNFRAGVNSGNEGLFWLKEIKKRSPATEVVMFTAYGDVELAVRAVREGAADFVQKPWENEKMLATLQSALRLGKARKEVKRLEKQQANLQEELNRQNQLVFGTTPSMLRLAGVVRKVAATDASVLITGENGSGKEVIVREIHRLSKRSHQPLVNVDMGTIPENLFESELFGHRKGAFTDAHKDKSGKFELASGGTLFLDEIGNLPLRMQPKLLSVLQNRQLEPLGATRPVDIDIRLISATNSDLESLVQSGGFREDLLYRINTIYLEIPPLRERIQDIEALAIFFLKRFARKYRKEELHFAPGTFQRLKEYYWPGNIRELEHSIERSVILCSGRQIRPGDFQFSPSVKTPRGMPDTFEEMEKLMIRHALEKHEGNYSSAAAQLGITRQTLYNKSRRYGL